MPSFSNKKELEDFMNATILKVALIDIAKQVEVLIRDYIKKNLYDTYEPKNYVRSYDYINSLTIGKVKPDGNGFSIRLYFDANKIKPQEMERGLWNRHMTQKGVPTNEFIADWIENGATDSEHARKPIHVMANIKKELEETKLHVRAIKKALGEKGFKVAIL